MALEDRCSPQSAPSPPGVPHSPQSTSSPLHVLDMSMSHNSMTVAAIHHTTLNPLRYPLSPCGSLNDSSTNDQSPPPCSHHIPHQHQHPHIKEEESDSIMGDNEQDISVTDDDDDQQDHRLPPPSPAISFSINNILSDRFGNAQKLTTTPTPVAKKVTTANNIFRPFEVARVPERSAFTRLTPTADALDFSRQQQQQQQAAAAAAAMMLERANFLSYFNPAAYPRIHEEIMRRSAKPSIPDKMPPLGSLCKTVSQIGQPQQPMQSTQPPSSIQSCMSSPPPASNVSCTSSASSSSSSSSAGSISVLPRKSNSPQPIPPPSISRDSGMESSDDTRSDNGSTKDENGQTMWPAWV